MTAPVLSVTLPTTVAVPVVCASAAAASRRTPTIVLNIANPPQNSIRRRSSPGFRGIIHGKSGQRQGGVGSLSRQGRSFALYALERACQETAHDFGLLPDIHQKRVVAVVRGQFTIRHIAIAAAQRAHYFLRL